MFNFIFNRPEKHHSSEPHQKTVGEEMRDEGIEKLRRGLQDSKRSLEARNETVGALITLLKEKLTLAKDEKEIVLLKIDIAEAETYQAELERGEEGHPPVEHKEKASVEAQGHTGMEDLIENERRKIEAAKRGIELAKKLNDDERVEQLEQHIKNSTEIIAAFTSTSAEGKRPANDSEFDRFFEQTNEGRTGAKIEARRRIA